MSKYKTSHEYANALKDLADEILSRPDFQLGWTNNEISLGVSADREEILAFAKNLHPLRKEYTDSEIVLRFGAGAVVARISGSRKSVCRLVKPAQPAEYECDPLLTPEEEAAL